MTSIRSGAAGRTVALVADAPDLYRLAGDLSRALTAIGVRHAISGSIAMAAHGFPRGTSDLDVLVVTDAIRLPKVFEIVRSQGFEAEDAAAIQEYRERGVAAF